MEYFLKQIDPGNPHPLLISLHEDEMKIGRSTVMSLCRYSKVSRYHASFSKKNDSWFITDLKSMNYLFVNFERIQQPVQLNIGDIIGFGSPNVSQDGGFVCVLAIRSKVIVKQEPYDDECVEIPINSNSIMPSRNTSFSINGSNIGESITRQTIYNGTDKSNISNIDSKPKNLWSISSEHEDFRICKTQSSLNTHQNVNVHSKVQDFTVQPSTILNYLAKNTKKEDNLNPIEFDTVSTPLKLNVSPLLNTRDLNNAQVECVSSSSEEIISKCMEHSHAPNHTHPISINTESALERAYPGIEYLEGLEELRSCTIFTSNVTSKSTDLEKFGYSNTSAILNFDQAQGSNIETHLNRANVKQEYPEDLITDLGSNFKVKTKKLENISESSENCIESIHTTTLPKCESIIDMEAKKSYVVNEHLPKDCAQDGIQIPNDLIKLEKSSDTTLNISSQSLNTSLSDQTSKANNAIKNMLSSHKLSNSAENVKENVSHCKDYWKEFTESIKAETKHFEPLTLKEKHNKLEINYNSNEVESTKPIQLKAYTLNNLNTCESNDLLPELASDRNIQLVKCDSKNSQISLKAAEMISCATKEKLDDNSSELQMVKEHSKLSNTTSQSKQNNLTVAINLKVRKNKIVSSDSDCEEENENLFSSSKSFLTGNRHKRKHKKHHIDNSASKRSNTKKGNAKEFCENSCSEILYSPFNISKVTDKPNKAPSPAPICSKRRYSGSDYSDEYYRSRSPPANENSQDTKHKSLRRTLLIDFKPMEYRSRKLRGREEWFQERTGTKGVKSVTQTSKHKYSRQKDFFAKQSNTKSYETVNSVIEQSKRRKQIVCCQKRKEKIKSTYLFKKSETNSQTQKDGSQKITEENSLKNTFKDSAARKRVMPPVPKRKNSFCSRMGFLLDTQVKCDVKSVNNDSQREVRKIKKTSPKQLNSTKVQVDLSLELDLSADKQTPTKTNPLQHNFTKSLTNSEAASSFIEAQHSISKIKEHSKIPNNKHESDRWIPILELDSRQSNTYENRSKSDKISDSSMLKTTTRGSIQSKAIKDPPNSRKESIVSFNQQILKDSTKLCRKPKIIKHFQASSTLLVEMIVSWNPKWLVEQKKNKNPPPLIAQGASCLNLSFSSYESYVSSYFPMIVLELWECLFRECNQHLVSEKLENCNNFYFSIKTLENRKELTGFKCESVVSDALCYHPTEGKIVLLNIKEQQECRLENYTFGCIRSHTIEEFKRGSPEWNSIPVEALNNAKIIKFEVVVKKIKRPIQLNSIYLAHGLSNIKQKLQMADALRTFRNSPLCKDIYHPREETLMFCDSSREALAWDNLNRAISEEVQNPISKTKVLLLQAPPGTGKTKCVIELIKKLVFGNSSKIKVLVCAPSHTSLDEILNGLVRSNDNYRNSTSTNFMKLVRLGEDDSISENLKEYYLTRKVARLYKEDCVKKMHSRECTLKLLEEKINAILFKQQTSQDMYTKINKSTSLKALVDKLKNLKDKNLLHHMDEGFRKGYECLILQESDVLLSVLDCSMLPAVRTFLKSGSAAYCIVDEAAQCNELQILQCLHHEKIEKLILFGDPQQQKPTTISKYAAKCGFGRSIFERFFLHFKKKFHKIPYPAFSKQYRMHSEICQFPSKYFYNQKLSTAEGTDKRYANFPLKPYTVLDVLDPGPIPDDTESSLIMYICSLLIQACPTATIGIILTEKEQKLGLSLPLDPEYSRIKIDALEEFQGKEKDIVLIPCIRKPSIFDEESIISCDKMLNVALTRAKQCLIICGQVASKIEYPHWRALMDDALARNCYLCVASVTHLPLVFANYIKKVY